MPDPIPLDDLVKEAAHRTKKSDVLPTEVDLIDEFSKYLDKALDSDNPGEALDAVQHLARVISEKLETLAEAHPGDSFLTSVGEMWRRSYPHLPIRELHTHLRSNETEACLAAHSASRLYRRYAVE